MDIGICWTLEFDDVCGWKIKPAVIQRLEGMWCPDCMKFYHIGETTCKGCGQELLITHTMKKDQNQRLSRYLGQNLEIKSKS